jgi:glycolate oxidase FAD binding subunit
MKPKNISELQDIVRAHEKLTPCGRKSKQALQFSNGGITEVDMSGISGLIEYIPGEFTFSALAGTTIKELDQILSDNGQYLPFDPPFVEQGATIGGTVASGLNGPGRYRYGGIRDFIIGIQYIDGHGDFIRSGGQVVKNAAGFDLSKLMVGSLGAYGALIECSFKVFPKPNIFTTLELSFPTIGEALEHLIALTKMQMEVLALDLIPKSGRIILAVRLGGISDNMPIRFERLQRETGKGTIIEGEEEEKMWQDFAEFNWVEPGEMLVKIPITAKQVIELDKSINELSSKRHYSIGGNVAWVAWSKSIDKLDQILGELELSGLVVVGQVSNPRLGKNRQNHFTTKVKQALDPLNKWVEV